MKFPLICVGTYHKTGTLWMQSIFMAAAQKLGVAFYGPDLAAHGAATEGRFLGIYFDDHCRIPKTLRAGNLRGFRLIRDPRDVVISGAHYHSKSTEPWLQRPIDRLGGLSYQAALGAQGGWQERYAFEMQETAGATIDHMLADIALESDVFRTVHYEDLIGTEEGHKHFAELVDFLGFTSGEANVLMDCFTEFSLASGKKADSQHVRSGERQQWKSVYTRALAEKFIDRHGDTLIALGYEKDHDWASMLGQS